MDGILAVTYRCNSRCTMCYTWKHPTRQREEIRPQDLESLPSLVRLNITGGEPFLRNDLSDLLEVVKKKAKRVVVSTNGLLTQKTVSIMERHPEVGVRISFEGKEETNDCIRGSRGGYRRALKTLKALKSLGLKDLGIAVTVSDQNAEDLPFLYQLASENGVELATAILHNAYYFHKEDNAILDKAKTEAGLNELVQAYLGSSHPKDWFRAYFTQGLINHMQGRERSLKCSMAKDSFFIDPHGHIRPCNVMDHPFGNIRNRPFDEIWKSPEAEEARRKVDRCDRNCWMIGSVGHLMRYRWYIPAAWIFKHRWLKRRQGLKHFSRGGPSVCQPSEDRRGG